MVCQSQLAAFAGEAIKTIAAEHGRGPFTTAQKLSLLVGLCGVGVVDADGAPRADRAGRTFTLIYTDPTTGRSNYQTACVPDYGFAAPFTLQLVDGRHARLAFRGSAEPFHGIDLAGGFGVRVHASIRAASNHYFSRVDPHLNELPTAMLVSPYSSCAGGCRMCARAAAKTFARPARHYVEEHVALVRADYEQRGWSPQDLWSVNLVTGCQPSPDRELAMMVDVMAEYRRRGFTNARFQVYSYHLTGEGQMRALLEAGAMGHIGTIETFDDERRIVYWGREKGAQTFESHRRRYALAHEVGFPIVETNYVVGTDSYAAMLEGIRSLDRDRVVVVPNMMRSYNSLQLSSLHPDLWERGFRYALDGFEAAVSTYRHPTIKGFAGQKAVDYLSARGWRLALHDLPVRHT